MTQSSTIPVSANNPCPFLRALVASGQLADAVEPLGKVAQVIAATARQGEGQPVLPRKLIEGIAFIAHGVSPAALLTTRRQGLRLNALRGGPLDKKGVGSGILNAQGKVDAAQLARLREFSKAMTDRGGKTEAGLGLPELRSFMDANFERAAGHRRRVDRALMNGEWPVLLKVMGKNGPKGRFLSVKEVEDLFSKRSLPKRMSA